MQVLVRQRGYFQRSRGGVKRTSSYSWNQIETIWLYTGFGIKGESVVNRVVSASVLMKECDLLQAAEIFLDDDSKSYAAVKTNIPGIVKEWLSKTL